MRSHVPSLEVADPIAPTIATEECHDRARATIVSSGTRNRTVNPLQPGRSGWEEAGPLSAVATGRLHLNHGVFATRLSTRRSRRGGVSAGDRRLRRGGARTRRRRSAVRSAGEVARAVLTLAATKRGLVQALLLDDSALPMSRRVATSASALPSDCSSIVHAGHRARRCRSFFFQSPAQILEG